MAGHIVNFHEEPAAIGRTFRKMVERKDFDPDGYCVEWCLNNSDVQCMIRLNQTEDGKLYGH